MIKDEDKPFIPPDTCPYINHIMDLVESLEVNNSFKNKDFIERTCKVIYEELELLRLANSSLRNASYFWKKEYDKVKPIAKKVKRKKK
jgi:hypothetical protein